MFLLLSLAAMLAWVFVLLPCSVGDPDLWWHLTDIDYQLHACRFLRDDVFSYTARHSPWIDYEWLSELIFWCAWHVAKESGVYAVTLLCLESIFVGLFFLGWRRSGNVSAALLSSAGASFLSTVSFAPRTLLFGWLCLVLELLLLELASRSWALVIALPVLLSTWGNFHGSWILGLLIMALFAIDQSFRPALNRSRFVSLTLSAVLGAAAILLNPYGWRLVAYPFDLALHQKLNLATVEEWQPLDFRQWRPLLFLVLICIIVSTELCRRGEERKNALRPVEWLLLVISTVLALQHSRFLFFAAICLAAPLSSALAELMRSVRIAKLPQSQCGTQIALVCFAGLCMLTSHRALEIWREGIKKDPHLPGAAVRYLSSDLPPGKVFNEFTWGGYLIHEAPEIPVFIDSRVDIYERNGVFKDYLDIVSMRNSLDLLRKYQVRYVLFAKDTPLVYLLEQTRGWKKDYEDGTAVILERCATI